MIQFFDRFWNSDVMLSVEALLAWRHNELLSGAGCPVSNRFVPEENVDLI